jgi:hypothetical protein
MAFLADVPNLVVKLLRVALFFQIEPTKRLGCCLEVASGANTRTHQPINILPQKRTLREWSIKEIGSGDIFRHSQAWHGVQSEAMREWKLRGKFCGRDAKKLSVRKIFTPGAPKC